MSDLDVRRVDPPAGTAPAPHRIHGRHRRASRTVRAVLRLADIVLAGLLLLVLLPLMVGIALAVAGTSRGPVLYAAERCGRDGRRFTAWKFRTMVNDAEEQLRRLLHDPEVASEFLSAYKLRRDPRVTRLGAVLRRTSLDELPQLCNVLTGDMSLVGPRPMLPAERPRYGPALTEVLSVRPGLTGIWQVTGRSDVAYAERVRLQLASVAACQSPRQYARLVARTAGTSWCWWRNGAV